MARLLGAHDRQRRLRDPERAEDVGLDLGAGLRLADFLDGAELAVAGIVDDDVEAAEALVGLGDRGVDGRLVVDVEPGRRRRRRTFRPDPRVSTASRAVAATRSPRARAASAQMRPNPLDAPVMNQIFDVMASLLARAGALMS